MQFMFQQPSINCKLINFKSMEISKESSKPKTFITLELEKSFMMQTNSKNVYLNSVYLTENKKSLALSYVWLYLWLLLTAYKSIIISKN